MRGERTVGFLVEDPDVAVAELRAAHVEIDDQYRGERTLPLRALPAPNGELYELVEVRTRLIGIARVRWRAE